MSGMKRKKMCERGQSIEEKIDMMFVRKKKNNHSIYFTDR